jgi:hypothetical protein
MSTDSKLVANTHIVCINEIKLNLMGISLQSKGFSTMLCNLFVSSEETVLDGSEPVWQKEYLAGLSHEIYRTPLSPYFQSMPFKKVAAIIYERTGAVSVNMTMCYNFFATRRTSREMVSIA